MAQRQQMLSEQDGNEGILFNPSEHKDLAHFFTHVDQAETFALTANEWLGIRSNGMHFQPVGSVGPMPARPNPSLTNATRSLMAFNKPVSISPSNSRRNSLNTTNNGIIPSPSSMSNSVRAWRPHEIPFDPGLHGQPVPVTEEEGMARRSSTSSSNGDHSMDPPPSRKRPAPAAIHPELISAKRQRSSSAHTQSAPSISPISAIGSLQTKPPLLTAQQKKANHILSEQKRRAKIRRGYDALCEVVPALKSAVLAEQEAIESKKKRGKHSKGATATDDGRAGPKSESIVLSQST
jgi:hypothetical protein